MSMNLGEDKLPYIPSEAPQISERSTNMWRDYPLRLKDSCRELPLKTFPWNLQERLSAPNIWPTTSHRGALYSVDTGQGFHLNGSSCTGYVFHAGRRGKGLSHRNVYLFRTWEVAYGQEVKAWRSDADHIRTSSFKRVETRQKTTTVFDLKVETAA